MIQTQLLPLQPPYQIIAAGGQVGLQIATLIVVEDKTDKDGNYRIATHSHPVVNYADKEFVARLQARVDWDDFDPTDYSLSPEGAVWDKVAMDRIDVLGVQGSLKRIDWGRFFGATGLDIAKRADGLKLYFSMRNLKSMGVDIVQGEEEDTLYLMPLDGTVFSIGLVNYPCQGFLVFEGVHAYELGDRIADLLLSMHEVYGLLLHDIKISDEYFEEDITPEMIQIAEDVKDFLRKKLYPLVLRK